MVPEKVLILHDYPDARGGAEIMSRSLRQNLRNRGIDARLLTAGADSAPAQDKPDYLCKGGTGTFRALSEVWNFPAARKLRAILKEFQPDIVHLMMFATALSPSVLRELKSVPVIHTVLTYREICPSGLRWLPGKGKCDAEVGKACYRQGCFNRVSVVPRLIQHKVLNHLRSSIDRSVALSDPMKDLLQAHGWQVDGVQQLAVEAVARQAPMAETPTIAYAGRLEKEKGVDWFLRAVAHAGPALAHVRIDIFGDGQARAELQRLSDSLGLGDQVTYHGHLPQRALQSELDRAWVQVVPSLWPEPFGMVVVEAMSRGTPVIVADTGTPPTLIQDGVSGWIVPAGDVAAFGTALRSSVADRETAKQIGENARKSFEARLSMSEYIDMVIHIYTQLVKSKRPHRTVSGHAV